MSSAVSPTGSVGQESIITGDAVELEVRPAAVPLRAVAAFIDAGLWGCVGLFLIAVLSGRFNILNNSQKYTYALLGTIILVFVVPFLVELLTGGRSVGKLVVGIQVLREDGGPVRLRHVFVRTLVGIVENWLTLGCLATVISLSNARGRRLGDLLAGTYCVRMRDVEAIAYPLVMPSELIDWVRNADIGPVPSGLANRARIFLTRAAEMNPPTREAHAYRLASDISQYVSPLPPAGTHPERFLAAVLVRRRNEEYLALVAQETITKRRYHPISRQR